MKRIARYLQRILSSNRSLRRYLEGRGVFILPPNFYSAVPTLQEIDGSFEYRSATPYQDKKLFDHDVMTAFLRDALTPFAAEFDPPRAGDPDKPERYFWEAPGFSFSDAMAYYCIIRHLKPKRIVEVGCGFSTLVAAQALERNRDGRLTCIEPYPREFLKKVPAIDELVEERVQDVEVGRFQEWLRDGDMLFIDSTHTVKCGSDCLYLYLKVLPALASDLFIHVHDVFLPEPMPKSWLEEKFLFWTEQYLLLAYLLDNPKVRVLYGSQYHARTNHELLRRFMGGKAKEGGASFWFRRTP